MTRTWIGALLIAATALTPIAASAQDGGFGTRIVREAQRGGGDRAPRAERAQRSADAPRRAAPQAARAPAPQRTQYQRGDGGNRRSGDGAGQQRRGGDGAARRGGDGSGGNWQGRRADRPASAPVRVRQSRADAQRSQWQGRNRGGEVGNGRTGGDFDRNNNGRVDQRWDRNGNGRTDRQWDRNRDGNLDRRWDRNDNGQLDRRYDRNRDGNLDRRYDRDRDGRANRYDRNDNRYGNGYGRGNDRRWNSGWRNDRRYDWRGHRQRYGQTYRLGRYYSPYRNYSYRSLSVGFFLDSLFYSNRYWINDPYNYRLPDVYGPYRWVRYYDDALLVDVETGEVVDVINNFFW